MPGTNLTRQEAQQRATVISPSHYVVELDQVGCPDPSPRNHRFFNPLIAQGSADVEESGSMYIRAAYHAVRVSNTSTLRVCTEGTRKPRAGGAGLSRVPT